MRKSHDSENSGFTIVELLIVIVVIGILAAITIVAYNGITSRAQVASLQSALTEAGKQIEMSNVSTGSYPVGLAGVTLPRNDSSILYAYNQVVGGGYCLMGTANNLTYTVTNSAQNPTAGSCPNSGPVGWWPMNNSAQDWSGNGLDGTISGNSPTTGASGATNGAYSFNGAGNMAIQNIPVTNQPFTVTAWFNLASFNSGQSSIAGDSGGNQSVDHDLHLGFRYSRPFMGFYSDDLSGTATISTGQWYFIAYVLTTQPQQIIYLNGALDSSRYPNGFYQGNINEIGNNCCNYGDINGSLDDVRVYNRALSSTEIQALYAAGAQ